MLKKFEVGFEITVFNQRFEKGYQKEIKTFHILRKSFDDAVKDGYKLVTNYLSKTYENYTLDCFDVEVF